MFQKIKNHFTLYKLVEYAMGFGALAIVLGIVWMIITID
jgi:hypothetical protein